MSVSFPERATYWDVLRNNSDYRKLWLAQVGSYAGDWFSDVAVLGLVLALTGSPSAAGLSIIAALLSNVVLTPWAGLLADRVDRKTIMVVSDLSRAVLALGFILVRSPDQVWVVYLIQATLRGVSTFFYPAQAAALPNLVKKSELLVANSLSSATWGAMLAIGAALGGVVSATLGRDTAFTINALSFLISGLLIASIKGRFAEPGHHQQARTGGGFRDSLKYAKEHLPVWAFLLVKFGWGIGGGVILLLSVFATQVFNAGDAGIGWLYAARGTGALLGPYLVNGLVGHDQNRMRWSIAISYVVNGLGYLGFSLAPTLAWGLPFVLIGHLGSGASWVLSSTMLQQVVPDRLRGRIFSIDNGLVTLAMAASTWVAGVATPVFGPRLVCAVLALVALVSAAGWALLLILRGSEMNAPTPTAVVEASGE